MTWLEKLIAAGAATVAKKRVLLPVVAAVTALVVGQVEQVVPGTLAKLCGSSWNSEQAAPPIPSRPSPNTSTRP
jgi:hypothetical protein